ncbi:hypothetical protein QMK19_03390 [Streptomyces sp. H10-C2]|uniref:hypothetical protein n=1 Tax=unclassified Streptomyces TaxID=2593676 RepID=UPI0024BA981A|nr:MULTISPECIES: hypothetical protein [unclassified Streptomyces]MDJ0342230.1 hypothetical protein [Streptomyces sp. PH10-H1]MDJ0368744.1 hypothetical protein [Streptomyces sp. H10-C2]
MDRIVIDQARIRIDPSIKVKPGWEFPRPLTWWQHMIPCWLDAAEDATGHIVLSASGRSADGRVEELSLAMIRRDMRQAQVFLDSRRFLDFSDAIVAEAA